MMIHTQIQEDIKENMRSRNTDRLATLRLAKNALDTVAKEKGVAEIPDPEAISVLRREIKKRQDSVASYTQGGRADLADKEKAEIVILEGYLPQGLTEKEIDDLVQAAITEAQATSRKQMGAVMKIASAKAAGRADGKTLSAKVQALLPA